MTTAREAMEALRLTAQEEADANKRTALARGVDEVTRAEARGTCGAYQAMVNQIAKIQAEGFSDPDSAVLAVGKARADAYEALLLELGRLLVAAARGDATAQQRSVELMTPYVALALPTDSSAVQ